MNTNNEQETGSEKGNLKSGKGATYLSKLTPLEFIEAAKSIQLNIEISRQRKRNTYIDTLVEKLSPLEDDLPKINQFFDSEIKKIKKEIFITKEKGGNQELKLAEDKLDFAFKFNIYYLKRFKDEEKVEMMNKEVETGNTNFDSKISTPENIQENEFESQPPNSFEQINYSALISKEELLSDFMLLSTGMNPKNNEPIMEEKEVHELLEKNFKAFGKVTTIHKYFSINLLEGQKYILPNFIFKIYHKYEKRLRGNKEKYALFIKNNFELYKDDDLESLTDIIRYQEPTKFQINLPKSLKKS